MKLPHLTVKTDNTEKKATPSYSFLAVLFSVFVALILWFYVQDAEAPDYKKTFTSVNVSMQGLSSSFSVIEGGENTVDITLIGKRSDLNKLKSTDLEAYIDLSAVIQPGSYQEEISVLVPEGTELSECFPQKATLFVDQTISKTVPVKVELGRYTVGENSVIEATPAIPELSIKGPKTVLDQVDTALIRTGDLGEIAASFESNLDYGLYTKDGALIESRHLVLAEANMKVHFAVYKTKTVPLVVKGKNGWWPLENMKYTVTPQQILIKGEPSLVDAVESIPCVILDETLMDTNRYSATLSPSDILLPEGIRLGEVLGDIKVNLTLSDNTAKNLRLNLASNRVAVTAPENGLTYTFGQQVLDFKVRGSFNTIYQAKADDFYLNVDLSAYNTPGEYEVPVEIIQTSETEGKYYPVGVYTVKVLLSE